MKRAMKHHIAGIVCVVLLLMQIVVLPVQADYFSSMNYCVRVSGAEGSVYIRSGPGTDYSIIAEVGNGTVLTIVGMEYNPYDGFMWGSTSWNGRSGCWISLRQTTILSGAGYPNPDFYVQTKADGGSLNLRTAPGTSYPVILEVPNGVELHVTGLSYNSSDGYFWGAVYYGGYNGWISLRQTNLKKISYNPPSYSYNTPGYGSVLYSRDGGELNLRANPGHNSPLVGVVYGGTPLHYYGENGFGYGSDGLSHEWFYVMAGNGLSGWVRSDLVW